MDKVTFEWFSCEDGRILDLVTCYRTVFADEPWNEWKKCESCSAKWGITQTGNIVDDKCPNCGERVVDFWPEEVVLHDVQNEICDKKISACQVAIVNDQIVGFCWMYVISADNLEDKIKLSGISHTIQSRFCTDDVCYLDEIGVLREYRGRKIAKRLFAHCVQSLFKDNSVKFITTRTMINPPTILYKWFSHIEYELIGRYEDGSGRGVLCNSVLETIKHCEALS